MKKLRSFCRIISGPGILLGLVLVVGLVGLSSCNVTRTVTTKSEYWQNCDTSVVIQTKTIETYDASKKL